MGSHVHGAVRARFGVMNPGRLGVDSSDERGVAPLDQSAYEGVLLDEGRDDPLAGVGRCGCAVVGNEIQERVVLLVADGTDHRSSS